MTRLTAGDKNETLSAFVDKLSDTKALELPANRLTDLYGRPEVLDHPGLKEFVIGKHETNEDIASLDGFLSEYKDGPAAGFNTVATGVPV